MEEILQQLLIMNENLTTITAYQSLILDEIKEVKGSGLYNNISDVCDKLDTIQGDNIHYTIEDLHKQMESMHLTLTLIESSIG